jgi:hypothetical protein
VEDVADIVEDVADIAVAVDIVVPHLDDIEEFHLDADIDPRSEKFK